VTIRWNGAAIVLRITTLRVADLASSSLIKIAESQNLGGRAHAPDYKRLIAGVVLTLQRKHRDSLVQ
jgi:hypothetical protein